MPEDTKKADFVCVDICLSYKQIAVRFLNYLTVGCKLLKKFKNTNKK